MPKAENSFKLNTLIPVDIPGKLLKYNKIGLPLT